MSLNTCFKIAAAILIIGSAVVSEAASERVLFDFTSTNDVSSWTEQSDTQQDAAGQSKAVLTLEQNAEFQGALLFTLLKPQSNGAALAGFRTETDLDLSEYAYIGITCRGQGENEIYRVSLRHRGENDDPNVYYAQYFQAPLSLDEFSTVLLPLEGFVAYRQNVQVSDADALDLTSITNFGVQVNGRVGDTIKQSGVSSLEIKSIVARSA